MTGSLHHQMARAAVAKRMREVEGRRMRAVAGTDRSAAAGTDERRAAGRALLAQRQKALVIGSLLRSAGGDGHSRDRFA